MKTDDVIDRLARDLRPVRPFRHPVRRGFEWLAVTALLLAAVVLLRAMVTGAPLVGVPAALVIPQAAAIAASAAAAVAAFVTVVPGASRRVLVWPMLAALIWGGGMLAAVLRESRAGAMGPAAAEWHCVFLIALGSLVPVAVLVHLLRGGAPLTPRRTLALGVLSAASLANIGACLSLPHTSNAALLLWHGVTVAVLVGIGAMAGPKVLGWPRLDVR